MEALAIMARHLPSEAGAGAGDGDMEDFAADMEGSMVVMVVFVAAMVVSMVAEDSMAVLGAGTAADIGKLPRLAGRSELPWEN